MDDYVELETINEITGVRTTIWIYRFCKVVAFEKAPLSTYTNVALAHNGAMMRFNTLEEKEIILSKFAARVRE